MFIEDARIVEIPILVIAMNHHSNFTSKRDNRKPLEFRLVTSAIAITKKGLLKNSKLKQNQVCN